MTKLVTTIRWPVCSICVILLQALDCFAGLYYTILCYAMLCCAMLCYMRFTKILMCSSSHSIQNTHYTRLILYTHHPTYQLLCPSLHCLHCAPIGASLPLHGPFETGRYELSSNCHEPVYEAGPLRGAEICVGPGRGTGPVRDMGLGMGGRALP